MVKPCEDDALAAARLPTRFGEFRILAFPGETTNREHIALALGDMAELGDEAQALHASAGRHAFDAGVIRLYAVGELSRFAVDAFTEQGSGRAWHFASQRELIEHLQTDLHAGCFLLVKGSRSAHMEHVVDALMEGRA